MDLTIDPRLFRPAWNFVSGNVERNCETITTPGEGGTRERVTRVDRANPANFVLLDASDPSVSPRLMARRGNSWAEAATIPGCTVREPGRTMLLPGDMTKLLASKVGSTIDLFSDRDDRLVIRFSRTELAWNHPPADMFPAPSRLEPPGWHVLTAADFARAVRLTEFAVDEKSTRYALGGVLLEPAGPEHLSFVATDGAQMSSCRCSARTEGVLYRPESSAPVAPIHALTEAARLARTLENTAPVRLGFVSGGAFVFDCVAGRISAPAPHGRFPAWQDSIPSVEWSLLSLSDPAELGRALDLASIARTPDRVGVTVTQIAGGLRFDGRSELGHAWAVIDSPAVGRLGPVFSIDPHRLREPLLALAGEPVELLAGEDRDRLVAMLRAQDYVYVLATLALERSSGTAA